ncbi:MAG: hypothetical protein LEGION0403_FIIPPAGN_02340 [Legionella sp.]
MIRKIAETPFRIFENIIRETVTSNYLVHQKEQPRETISCSSGYR